LSRLRWPVVVGIVLAGVFAVSAGALESSRLVADIDGARAADFGPIRTLTVGAPLHARPIPPGFLGLSLEYKSIYEYSGRNPSAINPVLVRLIANLSPGQRPQLRIGGDSTDRTWWPGRGAHKPLGSYIKLSRRWGEIAWSLIHALNARVILGIQFEADSPGTARVEARKLIARIGRPAVEALELGNEPELYGSFTWYHVNGIGLSGRPHGYGFAQYLPQYARVSAALPKVPLAGPSAGSEKWLHYVRPLIAAEPKLRMITLHRYPLQLCYVPPASPQYPTIAHLLSARATTGLADTLARDVAIAHAHHLPLRIDEINTISCGKDAAVGKSFASALWALQALFAFARVGVSGVNIHTYVGATYSLFRFHHRRGTWSGLVYPEYYGLLMFAQAAPPHSRLLRIGGAKRAGVETWATRDNTRTTRVVVINDDTRGRSLAIRIPGGGGSATIERLQAPSLAARRGVTIGGQTFGRRTTTGEPSGQAETETAPVSHGSYMVRLAGASAALVTIAPR
jgi:hypothetical protein